MNFSALSQGEIPKSLKIVAISWGISVGLVISANDIIYAIQDIAFDRSEGLCSVPAHFGKEKSIWIASACLICSLVLYLSLGWQGSLNKIFYPLAALPLGTICYVLKSYHAIRKSKIAKESCFFFANIFIALSFFISMTLLFLISTCTKP